MLTRLLPTAMSVNGEAKGCWKCWPEWLDSELLQHWRQVLGAWIVFFVTAGLTYHAPPVMLSAIKAELLGKMARKSGSIE